MSSAIEGNPHSIVWGSRLFPLQSACGYPQEQFRSVLILVESMTVRAGNAESSRKHCTLFREPTFEEPCPHF